jgi:hypothetical protein
VKRPIIHGQFRTSWARGRQVGRGAGQRPAGAHVAMVVTGALPGFGAEAAFGGVGGDGHEGGEERTSGMDGSSRRAQSSELTAEEVEQLRAAQTAAGTPTAAGFDTAISTCSIRLPRSSSTSKRAAKAEHTASLTNDAAS